MGAEPHPLTKPRKEYGCSKIGEEKRDWGLNGNMTRPTATEHITRVAVDAAPAKGANGLQSSRLQRRAGRVLPLREPAAAPVTVAYNVGVELQGGK